MTQKTRDLIENLVGTRFVGLVCVACALYISPSNPDLAMTLAGGGLGIIGLGRATKNLAKK